MKKSILTALIATTLGAGSAQAGMNNVAKVRASTKYAPLVLNVDQNYQAVYRDLKNELDRCSSGVGWITSHFRTTTELYTGIKEAELYTGQYGVMTRIYWVIDIKGADDSSTVTLKTGHRGWQKHLSTIGEYITDRVPLCKGGKLPNHIAATQCNDLQERLDKLVRLDRQQDATKRNQIRRQMQEVCGDAT